MSWNHESAFNILSAAGAIESRDVKYGRGFEINGVKIHVAKNPGGKVVMYINEKSATGEDGSTILQNSEYGKMQDYYPKEGDKTPRGSASRSLKKDESIYNFTFEREDQFNKLLNWYGKVYPQKLVAPLIKSQSEIDNKVTPGYEVDDSRDDQRKKVLSNTATRPGQLTFRRELVKLEKGTICSVTE